MLLDLRWKLEISVRSAWTVLSKFALVSPGEHGQRILARNGRVVATMNALELVF